MELSRLPLCYEEQTKMQKITKKPLNIFSSFKQANLMSKSEINYYFVQKIHFICYLLTSNCEHQN